MVGTSAWTSYLKLENSTSLSTQISNSIKLELDDLCLKQTRTRWNLKYSKYSGQNLENSSPNSSSNSKNWRNINSLCVWTRSSEARWNSNLMKSELVQALVGTDDTGFWPYQLFTTINWFANPVSTKNCNFYKSRELLMHFLSIKRIKEGHENYSKGQALL